MASGQEQTWLQSGVAHEMWCRFRKQYVAGSGRHHPQLSLGPGVRETQDSNRHMALSLPSLNRQVVGPLT